jgi:D-glycero-alpha-D-manno-heptose 1-phosphate guanylyltransferase
VEAVILAGGFGTRLRNIIVDLPKPMAPINDRPFLACLLDKLEKAGFETVTLAVGYMSEHIKEYFGDQHGSLHLRYSRETEPLGTGGAIKLALEQARSPQVFILNGDTYLEADYAAMLSAHLEAESTLTVAVHRVADTARYGALQIEANHISGFEEKGVSGPGMINAGVYLLQRQLFDRYSLPERFSFENEFLMRHLHELKPLCFETKGIFIDIGIPEDYKLAIKVLASRHQTV